MQKTLTAWQFILQSWGTLSTPQKVTASVAATLAIGCMVWLQLGQTAEQCELLQGRKLLPEECQKMQLALGKAGLSQFQIKNGAILVPRKDVAKYLQAIADGGAIPNDILTNTDEPPELNLFMSRPQQDALMQFRKKQQLAQMVRKLPFVAQAWVELDQSGSANAFSKKQFSCAISILPREEKPLSPEQVHTIRQIAIGSIAGMVPKDIVVTDLESGIAINGTGSDVDQQRLAVESLANLRENKELQDAIQRSLSEYPGIEVDVSSEPFATVKKPDLEKDQQAKSMLPNATKQTTSMTLIGSNGHASVLPGPAHLDATEPARISLNHAKRIRVSIPELVLMSESETITNETTQSKFDETKRMVKSRIDSLTTSMFPESTIGSVDVVLAKANATIKSSQNLAWLSVVQGRYGGAIIAAASGCFLCLILALSVRKKSTRPTTSKTDEAKDEAQGTDIKQNIDRLIEKDPEAVAQVLQDWIRKAS